MSKRRQECDRARESPATHEKCRALWPWFYFFTIVEQPEHLSWLVVYGWSVFRPQLGHL